MKNWRRAFVMVGMMPGGVGNLPKDGQTFGINLKETLDCLELREWRCGIAGP